MKKITQYSMILILLFFGLHTQYSFGNEKDIVLINILKTIKKYPHDPKPWFDLAKNMEQKHKFSIALELCILVLDLEGKKEVLSQKINKSKQKNEKKRFNKKYKFQLKKVEVIELMNRVSRMEVLNIFQEKNKESKNLKRAFYSSRNAKPYYADLKGYIYFPKEGKRDIWSLAKTLQSGHAPKKIKKWSVYEEPKEKYDKKFIDELCLKKIEFYRKNNLNEAVIVVESILKKFIQDKNNYLRAMKVGEKDLDFLVDFVKNEQENPFRDLVEEKLIGYAVQKAIRISKEDGNTRRALHWLLKKADELNLRREIFRAAEIEGIKYLDKLVFAKKDIVLSERKIIDSSSFGFLGDINTYGNFMSVAKRGEILFINPSYSNHMRGLVKHRDIKSEPLMNTKHEYFYNNDEIWGNAYSYKNENRYSDSDLLSSVPVSRLPEKYTPCTLVSSSKSGSGGVIGAISDFVEDHPVASALIAGSVAYALTKEKSTTSTSSSRDSNSSLPYNFLSIKIQQGSILPSTCKKFTVKIKCIDGYLFEQEDSSGDGFFQNGYANFYYVPVGKYKISFFGIDDYGKKVYSMETEYYFEGGSVYCHANISTKRMECQEN